MQITDFKVGPEGRLYVTKNVPEEAPIFKATLPASADDLKQFESIARPQLELVNFVKIPWMKILEVWSYFSAVYKAHGSEAIVLFHFDSDTREYTVVVPESYQASAVSLIYDPNQVSFCPTCKVASKNPIGSDCPRCEGSIKMLKLSTRGTMHSHGNMSAFHSGTDDDHEKNQTGFHITMGKVGSDVWGFELCPSFVVALLGYRDSGNAGIRFKGTDITLDHLVDFSNFPLAEPEQVRRWMSVAFTPLRLTTLPDSAQVVVENSHGERAVVYVNSKEGVDSFLAQQPSTRSFQVLSGSELKKILPPTVDRNGSLVWCEKPAVTMVTDLGPTVLKPITQNIKRVTDTRYGTTRIPMIASGRTDAEQPIDYYKPPIYGQGLGYNTKPHEALLIPVTDGMLVDFRCDRPKLVHPTTYKRIDPWFAVSDFNNPELPEELLVYGMRRLGWELDNWMDSHNITPSLERAVSQFQGEITREFGDIVDFADMGKELKAEKPSFPFLISHVLEKNNPATLADAMEAIISNTSTPKTELKRLWLKLAHISALLDESFPKILDGKKYGHWSVCVKSLGKDILDSTPTFHSINND
jgi:hypothetical protein